MYFTSNNASVKAIYLQAKSSYRVDNSMLCITGKNQYYISKTWIIFLKFPSILVVLQDMNKKEMKCKSLRTKCWTAA